MERTLCSQYCTYYKPDKNEALACRGFDVVERCLREGKIPVPDGHRRKVEPATAELIVKRMCTACDFYEHDCDFMQNRAALPCGGFVLLSQFLESGMITLEDIG